jgi:hypothetical protein
MTTYERAGLTRQTKREILDLAERWWERIGRHMVRPSINQKQDAPDVRTGAGPITISRAPVEPDINDGILLARPWEELRGEEQAKIMFEYFRNVWLPEHPEVAAKLESKH